MPPTNHRTAPLPLTPLCAVVHIFLRCLIRDDLSPNCHLITGPFRPRSPCSTPCRVEGTFPSLWGSSFILKWVLPVNSLHTFWTQRVSRMSFGSCLVHGSFGIHQVFYRGRVHVHLILQRFPVKVKEKPEAEQVGHASLMPLQTL